MHTREPEQVCKYKYRRQGAAASFKPHPHAPPLQGAHFRPQGRSGTRAANLHQPTAALDGRRCARITAQVRISGAALCCGSPTSRPPSGRPSARLRSALRPPPSGRSPRDPLAWPMAKRRAAEPLTFRVPWKRLLLSDFPEEPPLWVPPSGAARPLKRQGDAGTMAEPASAPRKRRGGGDDRQELQGCSLEPGEPPPDEQEEPRVSRAVGGGDRVEGAGTSQVADEVHSQVGPLLTSP